MNTFLRTLTVGACLAALFIAGHSASAQPMHTLTIQDGQVWVDDQLVPADEVPASLDIEDINANLSFSGNVIALNGYRYLLEGGRLRELGATEDAPEGFSFFFRNNAEVRDASYFRMMQEHARTLQEHEQEIEQLGSQVARPEFERLRIQARQAAQVAQVLPRIEVQNYLSEVQRQNQPLYEQLVREWHMEAEAQALAREIRSLPTGPERTERLETLRRKLDAMFERKQKNRRREIERLEQELEALNAHLQKREAYRQEIIEQRFRELIGSDN